MQAPPATHTKDPLTCRTITIASTHRHSLGPLCPQNTERLCYAPLDELWRGRGRASVESRRTCPGVVFLFSPLHWRKGKLNKNAQIIFAKCQVITVPVLNVTSVMATSRPPRKKLGLTGQRLGLRPPAFHSQSSGLVQQLLLGYRGGDASYWGGPWR